LEFRRPKGGRSALRQEEKEKENQDPQKKKDAQTPAPLEEDSLGIDRV